MLTCLFLVVLLKETLVLMCLASHFDFIDSWKLIVGHSDIYYAKKILTPFVCVEIRILVEKWNVYESHIIPRPSQHTCRLETTCLCLNTWLVVNKKFPNSHYFFEIDVNVCLLCAHHVKNGINLHTRRPNCQ